MRIESTRIMRWAFVALACHGAVAPVMATETADAAKLLVNPNDTYQTIDGFGGGIIEYDLHPAFQDPAFYDRLVFDMGLNMLRIIVDSARWKPIVDTASGDLPAADEWLDKFAMAFPMEVARQFEARGADQIFATVFSPPRWLKTNQSDIYGGRMLPWERENFASYLSAYIQSASNDFGVKIGSLSVQNELLFVETYASAVYNPLQLRETLRVIHRRFEADGIDINLVVSDEMGFAERAIQYLRPIMADNELSKFKGHFSTHGWNGADNWRKWRALTAPYNRNHWMTETSGYPPNWRGALALAENIHHTVADGGASGYIYMLLSSPDPGRFALLAGAEYTPKAHAFKHFSRLIRPGAKRLHVGGDSAGLLVSAFQSPDSSITVIALNRGDDSVPLELDVYGLKGSNWLTFTSSEEKPWQEGRLNASDVVEVPARSIISLYTIPGESAPTLADLTPENWVPPVIDDCIHPDGGIAIDESLHRATRANNIVEIQRLLDSGLNPNGRNIGGFFPLHRASWPGNLEPVEPLVAAGADPEGKDYIGDTPIHIAAGNGHIAFIEALISRGATVDAQNIDGSTPLHRAAQAGQLATVEMLLQHGADPNLQDYGGWNALHWAAAAQGRAATQCIAKLLEAGSDFTATTRQGWTPLHVAAANPLDPSRRPTPETAYPNAARLKLLVQAGADVNARDREGRTPLHLAAIMGETDYFEDVSGHPHFIYRTDAARYLIEAGADVSAVDNAGNPPAHYAFSEGYEDLYLLLKAFETQPVEQVKTANIGGQPSPAPSAGAQHRLNAQLLAASVKGDASAVQAALKAGADPNALPFQGGGPLHMAVAGGFTEVVQLLLKAGASPTVRDSDGYTSIDRAVQANRPDLEEKLKAAASR